MGIILPVIVILLVSGACVFLIIRNRKVKARLHACLEALDEAKKSNDSKDKFFSIVAHDLKSPFNSLMGLSEMLMLQAENLNSEQVQYHSRQIFNSSKRLYTLVDDLLQWSRAQSGKIAYNPEKIDINILSSNVVNLQRISVQEKDIVIALKMDSGLEAYADANIYSTVLRNLIANAIKFSKLGSTIYVSAHRRSEGMIEVMINDRGVGMEREILESIFKIDEKHTTVGTFNEQGTGLGLILCKEFVEINRGQIFVESEVGLGTTVRFTVPAAEINKK